MPSTVVALTTDPSHPRAATGLLNFRDLGGLPLPRSGVIRQGCILRSDAPHWITPEGADFLFGRVGVSTIIDLRTQAERDSRPSHSIPSHVQQVHIPLLIRRGTGLDSVTPILDGATDMTPTYEAMVQTSGDAIAQAVSHALIPGLWPVLVHCTAGKDRTGLVIALLLASLGVPRSAVADDFHASEAAMPAIMTRVTGEGAFEGRAIAQFPSWTHRASQESIMSILTRLGGELDGTRMWLEGRGVPPERFTSAATAIRDPRDEPDKEQS